MSCQLVQALVRLHVPHTDDGVLAAWVVGDGGRNRVSGCEERTGGLHNGGTVPVHTCFFSGMTLMTSTESGWDSCGGRRAHEVDEMDVVTRCRSLEFGAKSKWSLRSMGRDV